MNKTRSVWDYEEIVGRGLLEDLELLAENISGKVQHVNSTYAGGGVAEILNSLIPLFKGLGIETEWNLIRGDDEFFAVTKSFHNQLHGRVGGPVDVRAHEHVSVLEDLDAQIKDLSTKKRMLETYMH